MAVDRALVALLLALLLLAPLPPAAGQGAHECRMIVNGELRPVDCLQCIHAFMTALFAGRLERYGVSYEWADAQTVRVKYRGEVFLVEVFCYQGACTVKGVDRPQRLLEAIHEISVAMIKSDEDPICLLFDLAKSDLVGSFVCYDYGSGRFYISQVKRGDYCAEVRSFVDVKGIVTEPRGGWDIAVDMWNAFMGSVGAVGTLFVESLRAVGYILLVFFQGIIMWLISALATVALFVYIAAPVVVAVISYLPYVLIALGLSASIDAVQRAVREKSIEPLFNLPSRLYGIYIKPWFKVIEHGKNIFQSVKAGIELIAQAVSVIVKVLKYIITIIAGS